MTRRGRVISFSLSSTARPHFSCFCHALLLLCSCVLCRSVFLSFSSVRENPIKSISYYLWEKIEEYVYKLQRPTFDCLCARPCVGVRSRTRKQNEKMILRLQNEEIERGNRTRKQNEETDRGSERENEKMVVRLQNEETKRGNKMKQNEETKWGNRTRKQNENHRTRKRTRKWECDHSITERGNKMRKQTRKWEYDRSINR